MNPIQNLLHRIRWGPEFGRGEFVIGYYDRIEHESSHPREPPPQVLTEPDVNVSAHPAPIVQPSKWLCLFQSNPPVSGCFL
ncbi:MAG: DUF504 domain-containing protein [Methylococcales bacterium]|nr:DUF504 domain-containing protein [Methylococcales bacterium]